MPASHFVPLVHLLGFLTGAALYGMLFSLAVQRNSAAVASSDRLPLLTAIFGLVWNLSGLAAYGIRDFAGREPPAFLVALAYAALGFLPAVAVHSLLRAPGDEKRGRLNIELIWLAYGVSTLAAVLMLLGSAISEEPPRAALQMLTWFYAGLTIPLLVVTRRRAGFARTWTVFALAVFAVSALHLSHHSGAPEAWYVELAGHQASIPLIFAILYQDFLFALADIFLKRALTLFALVAVAAVGYFGVEVPLLSRHDFQTDPVAISVAIILWVGTASLYPLLNRAASWFVDHIVLRRADYAELRRLVASRVATEETVAGVMDVLCELLAPALGAEWVGWSDVDAMSRQPVSATVPIVTAEEPSQLLEVGPLKGGRRLMSDDNEMLAAAASSAARRIDALRLSTERYQRDLHEQEIGQLATEAELRALRAQLNPHFLFNSLNTLGFLIQTSPLRAQATLMKLTSLLRGVLRSSANAVTLGEEVDLVTSYLELESARFEERLTVVVDVPAHLRKLMIPPLILQPLAENAIKHGISENKDGGAVVVQAEIRSRGASREVLVLTVRNTGAAPVGNATPRFSPGVGLTNIEMRLRHHFGDEASLTLSGIGTAETVAEIELPLPAVDADRPVAENR